ncbi:MAG: inosine 5'-monophosphate dehydrogenase [Microgenomates bacterium OLB22]|nr:MAG: inosine 5'-monophosphate dehydrogenase [Microgenomates bacterium OLB22]
MNIQELLKTKNVMKVSPDETLGSVFPRLSSSHDVAFVFDEKDTYLGVINLYHCMVKKQYPSTTKVRHALAHAPKLNINDDISRAARLMRESKMYYLPVFSAGKYVGVLTAKRMLGEALKQGLFDLPVTKILQKARALVIVSEKASVGEALNKYKEKKVSKLMVTDQEGKLAGILSYYDLGDLVMTPKERQSSGSRTGEKLKSSEAPVKPYVNTKVYTISGTARIEDAARIMTDHEVGSVVVVWPERTPRGIITMRDLLDLVAGTGKPLLFQYGISGISDTSREYVQRFVTGITNYVRTISPLKNIMVRVRETKGGQRYEASVELKERGKSTVIKKEGINLPKLLHDMKTAVKNAVGKK